MPTIPAIFRPKLPLIPDQIILVVTHTLKCSCFCGRLCTSRRVFQELPGTLRQETSCTKCNFCWKVVLVSSKAFQSVHVPVFVKLAHFSAATYRIYVLYIFLNIVLAVATVSGVSIIARLTDLSDCVLFVTFLFINTNHVHNVWRFGKQLKEYFQWSFNVCSNDIKMVIKNIYIYHAVEHKLKGDHVIRSRSSRDQIEKRAKTRCNMPFQFGNCTLGNLFWMKWVHYSKPYWYTAQNCNFTKTLIMTADPAWMALIIIRLHLAPI